MNTRTARAHRRGWKRTEGQGRPLRLVKMVCEVCWLPWHEVAGWEQNVCPECRCKTIKEREESDNG